MPITDPLGRLVPAGGDAADLAQILGRYSLSDTGIVPVASRTAANALLAARNTAAEQPGVGVARKPVAVWRTDTRTLELHPNTGSSGEDWEHLGGRQHYATVAFDRAGLSAGGEPLILYASGITNASPGWTMVGNNLVIPVTAYYTMHASINVDGAAATLGRVFSQFDTTSGTLAARMGSENENNYAVSALVRLTAGTQLRIRSYHAAGGTRGYTATMTIAQVAGIG